MRTPARTLPTLALAAALALALAGCSVSPSVTLQDIEDEGFRDYLASTYDANADGRLDVGDKRVGDAAEAHLRAIGRICGEDAAALGEAHPGTFAVAYGKIVPFSRILRQLELNVRVFGDNRNNRRLHVREGEAPVACVESLRGGRERLHAALAAWLE